jgi:predicted amidohydrolase
MKIASIQMVSVPNVSDNLQHAKTLMEQAAQAGAELVVLPEYFCQMGQHDAQKLTIQEPFGKGALQQFLSSSAKELGIWLVGGTIPLSTHQQNKVHNSSLAFSPQGECVARYDKIHLFCFNSGKESYDEARVLEAGSSPAMFALPSQDGHTWNIGLSVCYDLRFAELYRIYAREGADLLLVPSAFTYTTGQAHWEVLLRARAIENLSYVVASAQGGEHPNGRRTWGHSMAIDPWGQTLAVKDQGVGMVVADLQHTVVQRCRLQLPALQHRVLG